MHKWLIRVWVLYSKELLRLKRNPAAILAAGLIILMAFLVSLENLAAKKAKRIEQQPCAIVYAQQTELIAFIQKHKQAKSIRFIQTDDDSITKDTLRYPPNIRCVAEIIEAPLDKHISIRFKAVDVKGERFSVFARWITAQIATFTSGYRIKQSTLRLIDKSDNNKTLSSIDLGSNQAKAMIGAMMIFSAQFFLCCALFISFTAHEKERGILQAIALTTVTPREMLLAKLLFHLSLSVLASFIIMLILSSKGWRFVYLFGDLMLIIFTFSSLGLISIATIITCLNRNQSTASLVGFCYLMVMGVIFALSNKFMAFRIIKGFMFESHAIELFKFWLNLPTKFNKNQWLFMLLHSFDLIVLSIILSVIAFFVFQRKGWRIH